MTKIFVFCNNKGCTGRGDWHNMAAIGEDGRWLAGHVCSSHGWAHHDMGISEDGWKRDVYAAVYPDGFTVEWVENPGAHEGLKAALAVDASRVAAEEVGAEV